MLNVGDKAPDFTLLDQDGKSVSLTDFRGKSVAVVLSEGVHARLHRGRLQHPRPSCGVSVRKCTGFGHEQGFREATEELCHPARVSVPTSLG